MSVRPDCSYLVVSGGTVDLEAVNTVLHDLVGHRHNLENKIIKGVLSRKSIWPNYKVIYFFLLPNFKLKIKNFN